GRPGAPSRLRRGRTDRDARADRRIARPLREARVPAHLLRPARALRPGDARALRRRSEADAGREGARDALRVRHLALGAFVALADSHASPPDATCDRVRARSVRFARWTSQAGTPAHTAQQCLA